MPRNVRQTGASGAAVHWVEAWADHLRKRFNSRALVSVRIAGAEPVVLSHIYALEGGGLVLVLPCEHDHGDHEHHGPEHHGPEHHRASPSALPPPGNAKPPEAHGNQPAPHHHGAKSADRNAQGEAPGEETGQPHGHEGDCPGGVELWLASPENAVFEVRSVEEGKLCTGLGYLAVSRTPLMLIARSTEPPPKRDHHERVDF
jgi:hypothetical protein